MSRFQDRHGNWKRIVCEFTRHQWPAAVCVGYSLYFCKRCGMEICHRTLLDDLKKLPPMPDDMRDVYDQIAELDP